MRPQNKKLTIIKLIDIFKGGVRCIPFMQVLLLLTTDLTEKDKATLDHLLSALMRELNVVEEDDETSQSETVKNEENTIKLRSELTSMSKRSNLKEMQLVILRLFSVLMSRSKSWQSEMKQSANYSSLPVSNLQPSCEYSNGQNTALLTNIDNLSNLITNQISIIYH